MSALIALISEPDGSYRIEEIQGRDTSRLDALQKLVGGYIEAVVGDDLMLYINEEGKLQGYGVNLASTSLVDQFAPGFSGRDAIVGTAVWMGYTGSPFSQERDITAEQVGRFALHALAHAPAGNDISIVRWKADVWVYDKGDSGPLDLIMSLVSRAGVADEHGTIEVYVGVSRPKWVETRVEIMDHWDVTLHDERDDRSYG